ncbi:hypothetical protein NIES4106_62100 (plasmid) [Fischerella sp. NIES-4106]|nr:hypothetical protein NIES4106_62100 [Fischerella sp. NIES-4106]
MTTSNTNTTKKELSNDAYQEILNKIRSWPNEDRGNLILVLLREQLLGSKTANK